MKKIVFSMLMVLTSVLVMSTAFCFASSTKTMTVYDEVIKSKDTAYVSASTYIQRFTISSAELKWSTTGGRGIGCKMKLHKGFLYYTMEETDGSKMYQKLFRVNVKNGKEKCLLKINMNGKSSIGFNYAISKDKIYYNYKIKKLQKKVMKLNGKSKNNCKIKVKNKVKKSNKKGYKLVVEGDESGEVYYLQTPDNKFEVLNEQESSADEE